MRKLVVKVGGKASSTKFASCSSARPRHVRASRVEVRAALRKLRSDQVEVGATCDEHALHSAALELEICVSPGAIGLHGREDRRHLQLGNSTVSKLSEAFEKALRRSRRIAASPASEQAAGDDADDLYENGPTDRRGIITASILVRENRLADLPVLVRMLCGLPVLAIRFDEGALLPHIKDVLKVYSPELTDDLADWDGRGDSDLALTVIDRLFSLAVIHDSASLADLGDVVLYEIAMRHRKRDVIDRLTKRAGVVLGTLTPSGIGWGEKEGDFNGIVETLHDFAYEHARVALTVLRTSVGCNGTPILSGSHNPVDNIVSTVAKRMVRLAQRAQIDLLSDMTHCIEVWWWDAFAAAPRNDPSSTDHVSLDGGSLRRDKQAKNDATDRSSKDRADFAGVRKLISLLTELHQKTPHYWIVEQRMRTMAQLLRMVENEWDRAEAEARDERANADGQVFDADTRVAKDPMRRAIDQVGEPERQEGSTSSGEGERTPARVDGKISGELHQPVGSDDVGTSTELSIDDAGIEQGTDPGGASLVVAETIPVSGTKEMKADMQVYRKALVGVALPLVATPDLVPVRQRLTKMLPHLTTVIDVILNTVARYESVCIPPVLLVGPPGCGKTTLAEELVAALGVPSMTWDAAGSADANILGVDRRWGSAAPGIHLDLIMEHQIANPAIIVDELEKLGGSRRNGDARVKLLGLLEPRRSSAFLDPYLSTPLNLSAMNWLFTANEVEGISGPLLNRLQRLDCPYPGPEHLNTLAPQLLASEYEARGQGVEWATPLDGTELDLLKQHWRGGSIRNLRRLVQAVVDVRDRKASLQ